jgi:hypothetical protein
MEAPESFPVFVRGHATRATRVQLLLVIAATSGFVWLADLVSRRSPLLALGMLLLAMSVASVALWGLIYGHATRPLSRFASWAARGLLTLGMLCGVIAGFAFLFALLGRPWMS